TIEAPDADLDFNGYVPELKAGNDRYFNPDVHVVVTVIQVRLKNQIEKVSYGLHRNNALHIQHAEYSIPEVRAGPLSQRVS
ncbi:MAG: hypothetical protein AAFP76_12405, partial [Bacteroidota bacterium]